MNAERLYWPAFHCGSCSSTVDIWEPPKPSPTRRYLAHTTDMANAPWDRTANDVKSKSINLTSQVKKCTSNLTHR